LIESFTMRRGALYSGIFHVVVILIAILGLPWWEEPLVIDQPIPIDVVTMADVTTPPKGKVSPEPPKPAPPKPEVSQPIPPAPTPPVPEPAKPEPPKPVADTPKPPEPTVQPPKPQPEPVQEAKTEPAPPEPEVQPTPPEPLPEAPKLATPKPAPKPPPPAQMAKVEPDKVKPDQKAADNDFASVLKTVEKLKTQTAKVDAKAPPQPPTQEATTTALSDQPLTMSEIDAIRQQIEKCWNVPAGARDAENLIVDVRVQLNEDGSVASADIVDKSKLADPFYRAAAESARRAVMLCSPLQLPTKKYTTWRTITLSFNPKEMFGT
jgi:TonB family protein